MLLIITGKFTVHRSRLNYLLAQKILIVIKITTSGDSQFYYLHVMVVLFSNQNDTVSNKK
jgi:NADH:ubiquinone oxidoreductase subunit 2 (subunit N)